MILSQLVDLDTGSAIDWIIENQYKFELVPVEPTMEMREAYHEAQERYEDCDGEAPDSHWRAMIQTHRLQSRGKI